MSMRRTNRAGSVRVILSYNQVLRQGQGQRICAVRSEAVLQLDGGVVSKCDALVEIGVR